MTTLGSSVAVVIFESVLFGTRGVGAEVEGAPLIISQFILAHTSPVHTSPSELHIHPCNYDHQIPVE